MLFIAGDLLPCDQERLEIYVKYKRHVILALFIHNLSFVYALNFFQQNQT